MGDFWRPTRDQVRAAAGTRVPDVLAAGLRVIFCGINPSLYSAAVGHHFARPGNRFWPTLHRAGFTDRLLSPFEDRLLPGHGYGITNIADRATATADQLDPAELVAGARRLRRKVQRLRPEVIAFLGVGAYRIAFAQPKAALGRQPQHLASAVVWVLPNPSGLNAHYQIDGLARVYTELRLALEP